MRLISIKYFFLAFILIVGALVRTYQWQRPLGDWHSWRQVDTASVTREYVKHDIDLLHPTYLDLSNIPSGKDNPEGHRMVEFPFINALIAASFNLTNGFGLSLGVFSRLWSIAFSLGATIFLFMIMDDRLDARVAFLSSLVFVLLPFNMYYHTTVLPEVPLVFFTLAAIWSWLQYLKSLKYLKLLMFTLSAALAMLLKPIFVFVVPALMYAFWRDHGWKKLFRWQHWVAAAVVIGPLIGWRIWIQQFPEGIPANAWLFNGNNIRFKGAFFRWLFADRFGRLILGYWGLIPLAIGLLLRPHQRSGWFFHWLFAGMIAYLTIFATGNVTHDYYQVFIVPTLAMLVGIGLDHLFFGVFKAHIHSDLLNREIYKIGEENVNETHIIEDDLIMERSRLHPLVGVVMGVVCFLFMLAFSWYEVRGNFNINNPAIVSAGEAVNRLTPADAKVIAPYGGDTALLYQTNRTGWPIGFEIQDKIEKGATYYVSTSYDDEARALEEACELVEQTDEYILIKLNCSDETY